MFPPLAKRVSPRKTLENYPQSLGKEGRDHLQSPLYRACDSKEDADTCLGARDYGQTEIFHWLGFKKTNHVPTHLASTLGGVRERTGCGICAERLAKCGCGTTERGGAK